MFNLLVGILGFIGADSVTIDSDTAGMPVDTSYVEYNDSPLTLPLFLGLRVPSYSRVDGLVLPWGPRFATDYGNVVADALITYRSDIGAFDLSADGRFGTAKTFMKIYAGRGTFTNDAWMRNDLLNSLATFAYGNDARNYYRADKLELRGNYLIGSDSMGVLIHAGALTERAWSVGAGPSDQSSYPFSVFRNGGKQIKRVNPAIVRGRTSSAVMGGRFKMEREETNFSLLTSAEHPWDTPNGSRWTQFTFDGEAKFPTFGSHRFESRLHSILTTGDVALPQRFAYLGDVETIETVGLLEFGGDNLFFAEGLYIVPLNFFEIPVFGKPEVALRYAAGNAGVGQLPALIQNIGLRLSVGFIGVDLLMDPDTKEKEINFAFELPF